MPALTKWKTLCTWLRRDEVQEFGIRNSVKAFLKRGLFCFVVLIDNCNPKITFCLIYPSLACKNASQYCESLSLASENASLYCESLTLACESRSLYCESFSLACESASQYCENFSLACEGASQYC